VAFDHEWLYLRPFLNARVDVYTHKAIGNIPDRCIEIRLTDLYSSCPVATNGGIMTPFPNLIFESGTGGALNRCHLDDCPTGFRPGDPFNHVEVRLVEILPRCPELCCACSGTEPSSIGGPT
jgi:hypothetical protein